MTKREKILSECGVKEGFIEAWSLGPMATLQTAPSLTEKLIFKQKEQNAVFSLTP